jgi:hypothetical protein
MWRDRCPISAKSGMYWQILVKLPGIKFRENPFSDSRVIALDRMLARHVEASKCMYVCNFFIAKDIRTHIREKCNLNLYKAFLNRNV